MRENAVKISMKTSISFDLNHEFKKTRKMMKKIMRAFVDNICNKMKL